LTRGQALVELAVCAPVILLLTLGAAATVQIVDASEGLQAATQAAAAEAARAPDPASAQAAAEARFMSMIAGYPINSTNLRVTLGLFSRTDQVVASSSAEVDVSWAALVLPRKLMLQARAVVPIELWRSRGTSS
jgi:Flp pilus assembly protein TadG